MTMSSTGVPAAPSASLAAVSVSGENAPQVVAALVKSSFPEAMARVSMVGNDLRLDAGVGVCGKEGQSVPVGVGQPTLRIDAMTVGGTAA